MTMGEPHCASDLTKKAINSAGENRVCILPKLSGLGTMQYVHRQATSNGVLQNMIGKVDLEELIEESLFELILKLLWTARRQWVRGYIYRIC